jgi:hypothetical protein
VRRPIFLRYGNSHDGPFAEAFAAIAATLPEDREADRRPDGKGGYRITLPHDVLNKLNYVREIGESYSDVIIHVATG